MTTAALAETQPFAHPFLKWAGGKTKLVPELLKHVPASFGAYHEPFVGGGALFWTLASQGRLCEVRLADTNYALISAYLAVQMDVEQVIRRLSTLANDEATFTRVRAERPERMDIIETGIWMMYLNKTCYNGLWRVNKSGAFNAPFAENGQKVIDPANLRACARFLRGVELAIDPFEKVLHRAFEGDLVYFDPPYPPLSKTSSFTAYTEDGFGKADHERLVETALELKKRGCHVILSNSDQPHVRELYAEGFTLHEVSAPRSINSKGAKRGHVGELVIT